MIAERMQGPRGRSAGELPKVDSACLKSRLFIFERLDLELIGPSWPNRLAQSDGFGGSISLSTPGSIPMSVKDFRWIG